MKKQVLEQLASEIRILPKPSCDHLRDSLKQRLMAAVKSDAIELPAGLHQLGLSVGKVSAGVVLDAGRKAQVKIAVFEHLEKVKTSLWRTFGRVTSVLAPVIMASFVAVYVLMIESVILEKNLLKATMLTDLDGNVYVIRDGRKMSAYKNMELMEKDIVSTDLGGGASIKYLDDSVSRLSEDSLVVVNRLFAHPKKRTFTVVEVEVVQGEVWNKVVNILDNEGSQFNVKANDVSARASRKSAFNVTNRPETGEVKVKVVESVIDVDERQVSEGHEAIIGRDKPIGNHEIVVVAENESADLKGSDWIAKNLEQDQEYMDEIVESAKKERKQLVGSLPDEVLYSVKQIKSDAKLFLTVDEVEKEKLKFDIAYRRMKEAQVLLDEGKEETAEMILDEFQVQTEEFAEFIDDLRVSDPDMALEMEIELNDLIDGGIKELEVIEKHNPLIMAKTALIETDKLIGGKVKAVTEDEIHPAPATKKPARLVPVRKKIMKNEKPLETIVVAPQVFTPEGLNLVDNYQVPVPEAEKQTAIEDKIESVAPQVFTPEGLNLAE